MPRSHHLLAVCALANAGGVIAWLPLLALLLPARVEAVAGAGRIALLSAVTVAGLSAASVAGIAFGWLSDRNVARGGTRRQGLVLGLALLAAAYGAMALAASPRALVAAIVAVQVAINATLAPLFALFAEEVDDAHKGALGGLFALAQPGAAATGALLVAAPVPEAARFLLVPLASALLLAPLLAYGGALVAAPHTAITPRRRDLAVASAARLLLQVAGGLLASYLLYYLESVLPAGAPPPLRDTATLLTAAALAPVPLALIAGRWSDQVARRKPFLVGAALVAAAGLVAMAAADGWWPAVLAFGVYAAGSTVFLSLHAGFALQLLPDPRHRGRDIGLYNLSNTLPALAAPALAWTLATPHDFSALLLVLAALSVAGAAIVLLIREPAQRAQ